MAIVGSQQGCATIAVTGAAQGIGYTLTNVAYRTFTFPQEKVRTAALQALKKMGLSYKEDEEMPDGVKIFAEAAAIKIEIRLTKVTAKATKMSVNAKKNLIIKDKALSVEIITQTGRGLGLPY